MNPSADAMTHEQRDALAEMQRTRPDLTHSMEWAWLVVQYDAVTCWVDATGYVWDTDPR